MPQLNRVDQLPLPNLSLYIAFSGLALFYAIIYALTSSQGSFLSMLWTDVWFTAVSVYVEKQKVCNSKPSKLERKTTMWYSFYCLWFNDCDWSGIHFIACGSMTEVHKTVYRDKFIWMGFNPIRIY